MVVTHSNTVNGLRYSEDPTILAWEVRTYLFIHKIPPSLPTDSPSTHASTTYTQTGNELNAPTEWTRVVAAFIKVGQA